MTLRFYLLRHAEAESASINKEDKDRALSAKGRGQALKLGNWLAKEMPHCIMKGTLPFDMIWCSSATRTRETLEGVTQGFLLTCGEPDIYPTPSLHEHMAKFEHALYHASAEKMLEVLHRTPADAKTVLMVGHNPGISELAIKLARNGDETAIHHLSMGYPTCGLTIFEFTCSTWQEAGEVNSRLEKFVAV